MISYIRLGAVLIAARPSGLGWVDALTRQGQRARSGGTVRLAERIGGFMKETVYIETSVISYFASRPSRDLVIAARQEITREKWPRIVETFNSYISALVLQEAEQGDPDAARNRLNSISGLPVLAISVEAERLASILIAKGSIPKENIEDALHIAIASVNGIDYFLTWNFTISGAKFSIQNFACSTLCFR